MLDNNKVENFINASMKYFGDNYSQPKRMQKGFSDCSSLIQKAGADLGFWNRNQIISTMRIRDGDSRFRRIDLKDAQRGDVLWYQRPGTTNANYFGHVAIIIDNNRVLEAILPKVAITSRTRIKYQRAYRIKALEATESVEVIKKDLKAVVTATALNVRDSDSVRGSVLGTVKKNEEIKITGQTKNKWYEIDFKGKKAYVSNVYVKLVEEKKAEVIENIEILINGKVIKKGYIVNGITYITINKKDLPVRQLFENMGAKVEWKNEQVQITL